jgi:hypothetical protein
MITEHIAGGAINAGFFVWLGQQTVKGLNWVDLLLAILLVTGLQVLVSCIYKGRKA